MSKAMDRRDFLKALGAASVATVVAAELAACAKAPTPTAVKVVATQAAPPTAVATTVPQAAASAAGGVDAYTFFTDPESAFVEAAVARLVPKDDLGPGAFEAGVAYFIDHQLAGGYGVFARHYTQGPWLLGTPEQGYQLRLVPRDIYRLGIADSNAYCTTTYKTSFDGLTTAQQDEVLTALEAGKVQLPSVPATLFFNTLRGDTLDGFFADPVYGGNRGKVGWTLVGFPGVASEYKSAIVKFNVPYTGPTRSIAEAE